MGMINYSYPFPFEGDYEVIPAPDSAAVQEPFAEEVAESSSLLGIKRGATSNEGNIKKPCHRLHSG